MSERNDERQLAELAENYGLGLDQVSQIVHHTARLEVALLRAASGGAIQQSHQVFDALLQVATRRPAAEPLGTTAIADTGVPQRIVNYYDGQDVITLAELVDRGPVPLAAELGGFGAHSMQVALLAVIKYLLGRAD